MSVINRMSKKQALTALVKVAKLQEKLLKKLAQKRTAKCPHCKELMDLDDPKNHRASKILEMGYPEGHSSTICGDCDEKTSKEWLDKFTSGKEHEFDSSWSSPSDDHKCEHCGEYTNSKDSKTGEMICDKCQHDKFWSDFIK